MTNTFKNNTLENKIEVLKEINAETAGWGINELLMENCDFYSSWHMNHMNETYAKLAKAYSYEELVERLNDWKEDSEDEASDEDDFELENRYITCDDEYLYSQRHREFQSDWDEDDIFFDEDYYNRIY